MNELMNILPRAYRRRGVRVVGTLLLRALLNLLGLAALLPVLALVLDPEGLTDGGAMARIYDWLGFASHDRFALTVCAAVVVVVYLKCLLSYLLARSERSYIYDLYRTLSRKLYIAYYDRGLPYIKAANSAVLSRNINVVCLAFAAGVLKPAATIVAEAMLFVLLFASLAIYAPMAALLAAGVFLPAVWLYYAMVRERINRYGKEENMAQREKARLVTETFRGYADIEINDAFPAMLRQFDGAMKKVVGIRMQESAVNLLPSLLTEIGLAVGMALLVALSLGAEPGHMQMLFGVFAVAALRLMPSVRNIMTSWATIRYNRYTIDILQDAGTGSEETSAAARSTETVEKMKFEHQITVRDLSFRFDDGSRLFDHLDLTIGKGERIGIRGRSGVGKTTLFNLLLGFYSPSEGVIEIDGTPLMPENRRTWQNRIGYVSQHLFIADGSFTANVALGVEESQVDRKRVIEALQAAHLYDFVAGLPQGIDTQVGECGCRLSGGQRQRIGIARALYRGADVLFFDEATSALDNHTEEEVNRSILRIAAEQPGLTLIVIAHRETSLEYCDRIITLGE